MVRGGMILERHTESLTHLEPVLVHWMKCAKCDTQRENVRMRVYGEVLLGRKICWKKKKHHLAGEYARLRGNLRTQGNLGYSWNTVRPHQFPDASVNMIRLLTSLTMSISPFFWLPRSPPCWEFPSGEKSTMSSFVTTELGVENYVCQFWLCRSKFCWIVGASALCYLVVICIGICGILLPCSSWRHISALVDACNLLFSTMVLL